MKSLNKIDFENTYANELNGICERCSPTSFNKSEILLRNYSLATELGIDESFLDSKECLNIFSCLLYTSPSPRDKTVSRMPSSA